MTFQEAHFQHQGPFRPCLPIILASASPRRQALLTELGLHFHVQPSSLAEPAPGPEEAPGEYVQSMAQYKAQTVARHKKPGIILAADTVVVTGQRILGKPESSAHALSMLTELNASTHRVLTGCCLLDPQDESRTCTYAVCTEVTFSCHSREILAAYVRTGEPWDKAGGYAIQGAGAFLVSHVHGSYSNVVGLPLNETAAALLHLQAIETAR
ncbi:MAG: Maf family protein [Desulfovermiculus sp.]